MFTQQEILELIQSLIWLLAGVGVFIVGMNFMSNALGKSAGGGTKRLLGKISNNRFSGVGIGAGVTAIIQSSSATSVMVIGLVNAGVLTLMQATPIIMGANIGTTVTGLLVSLKNNYFNMVMYALAFAGVMMGFAKKERVKLIGSLLCGLGLIFVGLNLMSSEQAFGNPLIEKVFVGIFQAIDFPLLLILVGVVFTALIQSSSASTGVVIAMVGARILPLGQALFIVLGANIGTCITALLASFGASVNAKRVAFIHFAFNFIGTIFFTTIIWLLKDFVVNSLVAIFPSDSAMSLQMRISLFHVIFNEITTIMLLPFTKQLVKLSSLIIKGKKDKEDRLTLKYVDDRILSMPSVALMQVKKEIEYMMELAEDNLNSSFGIIEKRLKENGEKIKQTEKVIDFTNGALTEFLIKLSSRVDDKEQNVIGGYFHVLNDLERIGDHAENFYETGEDMLEKGLEFSVDAIEEINGMKEQVLNAFSLAKQAFIELDKMILTTLANIENDIDKTNKELKAKHFNRLSKGHCQVELSPYYSSIILGLERVADHLVNVGFSILDPIGTETI